ncbi:T9SS type A sorting domain-containing protein [Dyadobacter endophyticus]|uniref:T9SS type A sorting domain-containing protein n=1 Tax=Dyadobacter endophyticus TaxID=1749036 RepID=UPI003CEA9496
MRNILKTAVAATLALFTVAAQVQADPIVSPKAECKNNTCEKFRVGMYRVRNTMSMNVMMEKEKGEKVAIRLMDSKGKLIHEEFVPKYITKTGRKISFDEMGDGVYTLEISNDNEKIVKSIYLSTKEVREVNRTLLGVN